MGTAEFAYNNKIYSSIKILLFKANYEQDPRIGFEIRKKGKYERAEKFVAKMKEIQDVMRVPKGNNFLCFWIANLQFQDIQWN